MTHDRLVVAVAATDDPDVELLADLLFRLGATAVSEPGGGPVRELVADLPAGAVARLDRPHRVLEPESA